MLAMVFVTFSIVICSAIVISRALTVKSECEVFSQLWAKSILSEYDVHLLEDYGIMAYFGNEQEVKKRLDAYIKYSASNKLDINIGRSSAELSDMELGEPENFRTSLNKAFANNAINSSGRKLRNNEAADSEYKGRVIKNQLVVDTMPSADSGSGVSVDSIVKKMKSGTYSGKLGEKLKSEGSEFVLIHSCFDSHLKTGDSKDSFLRNEWEYIVAGKMSDAENFNTCKRNISLIRNALNLSYLYSDKEKMQAITAIAEIISPEAVLVTQAIIAEAWALMETESDMNILLNNGNVPFVKTKSDWRTSLSGVLGKDSVKKQLDEESRRLLEENRASFGNLGDGGSSYSSGRGQSYEDYLSAMLLSMNDNSRLLRCMDLVQLNMKYRYYRDFNMMEYYTGVRFTIKANGKSYEIEETYK